MLLTLHSPEQKPRPPSNLSPCGSLGDLVQSYQGLEDKQTSSRDGRGQATLREIIRQYCRVRSTLSSQFAY